MGFRPSEKTYSRIVNSFLYRSLFTSSLNQRRKGVSIYPVEGTLPPSYRTMKSTTRNGFNCSPELSKLLWEVLGSPEGGCLFSLRRLICFVWSYDPTPTEDGVISSITVLGKISTSLTVWSDSSPFFDKVRTVGRSEISKDGLLRKRERRWTHSVRWSVSSWTRWDFEIVCGASE